MTDSQRKARDEETAWEIIEKCCGHRRVALNEWKRDLIVAALEAARAEERAQIAHWLRGLGRLAERMEPDGLKRFWYADVAGEVLQGVHSRALSSEAPAAREGGSDG